MRKAHLSEVGGLPIATWAGLQFFPLNRPWRAGLSGYAKGRRVRKLLSGHDLPWNSRDWAVSSWDKKGQIISQTAQAGNSLGFA